MAVLLWMLAALLFVLLDLAAYVVSAIGFLTFFTFDSLKPYRWYMIGIGLVGGLMLLPIADHFIGKAIRSVTAL